MKNTPKIDPAPARSRWRILALASLAANLLLLVWVLGSKLKPAASTASTASGERVTASSPSITNTAARPRAAGPYAALGSFLAENNRIPDLGWSQTQFAEFVEGIRSSYEGRGVPLDDDAKKLRDAISRRVQEMVAKEQPDPMQDYFRMLREKEGVLQTTSGLHYRITEPGRAESPSATDTVVISFAARLPDGRELPKFSRARVRMKVRDLLPGLAEGVQLLHVGGKALVYVPPALAFTPENWPAEIPRGAPLAFFVELHEVVPGGT